MTTVTLQADIKAKWPQGQSSYSPGSPEELAIIGIPGGPVHDATVVGYLLKPSLFSGVAPRTEFL